MSQVFLNHFVRRWPINLCLSLVPSQILLLCKQEATKKYDLSHVKFCMSGAAPLNGELCASLRPILPNAAIGQGYGNCSASWIVVDCCIWCSAYEGLTECVGSVCLIPPDTKDATAGSAGRLLPGFKARVIKSDGTLAGEGERGQLFVTGPSVASYYLGNPAAYVYLTFSWLRLTAT